MRLVKYIGASVVFILSLALAIFVLNYFAYEQIGFLAGKSVETFNNQIFKIAFFAHFIFAPIVILLASVQLFTWINQSFGKLHRLLGKSYLVISSVIAAPSGFVLAWFSDAEICFSLMALLWLIFNVNGYISIKNKDILKHKKWMTRSMIMCYSAIVLRLLLVTYMHYKGAYVNEIEYQWIAWLSWLPLLLVSELFSCIIKPRT